LKIIKDILNSPYLPGKRHQDIIPFKEKLNATEFGGISLTNLYGSFTEKRVKAFQKKHQLVVNVIGDPVTLKKLEAEVPYLALEEGVRHNDVLSLKKDLQTLGFANGMSMTNYYGSYTTKKVKDLQKYYGIKQTGKADKNTLNIIKEILNSPYLPGKRHQDIIPFKEKLNATEFGGISLTNLYGSFTEKRVKAFQKKHQLVVNGIGDPVTLKKLNNIHSELESNKIKIFIDAGHGGKDPDASGNGLKEKDLTLKIAKSIEKHLRQYKNVEVMMARSIDKTLSLKERTDMANKWGADFYYSVHINSFTSSTARGFETFVHPTTTSKNKDSQKMIHNEIMKSFSTNVINRGTKTANFHVLRESNMESMLAEYLFITNKSDSSLLKQQKMIDKI